MNNGADTLISFIQEVMKRAGVNIDPPINIALTNESLVNTPGTNHYKYEIEITLEKGGN
jgi:hypothetical protein